MSRTSTKLIFVVAALLTVGVTYIAFQPVVNPGPSIEEIRKRGIHTYFLNTDDMRCAIAAKTPYKQCRVIKDKQVELLVEYDDAGFMTRYIQGVYDPYHYEIIPNDKGANAYAGGTSISAYLNGTKLDAKQVTEYIKQPAPQSDMYYKYNIHSISAPGKSVKKVLDNYELYYNQAIGTFTQRKRSKKRSILRSYQYDQQSRLTSIAINDIGYYKGYELGMVKHTELLYSVDQKGEQTITYHESMTSRYGTWWQRLIGEADGKTGSEYKERQYIHTFSSPDAKGNPTKLTLDDGTTQTIEYDYWDK